jgi:membrane-associated phospholipid phosphatase
MADTADFIARHAIWMLVIVAIAGLILTALFWHCVQKYGGGLWTLAVNAWNALRSTALAQRLKKLPVVGPSFTRTLSVVRYLGLYAVVAFAIAIAALAGFFELAEEIGVDEDLGEFDAALASALGRHLSYETLRVFSVITHLGDRDVLAVLVMLVTVTLFLQKRWILAGAWLASTAGGGLLNAILKRTFERPRPAYQHYLADPTSWSFPSGHASGSLLVYSLLGYLVMRHTPRQWHIPIAVVTVALIVFVGSSRVLLQVHYFSDVLAGYASAAAWSALCIAGLETARWRGTRSGEPQKTTKTKEKIT